MLLSELLQTLCEQLGQEMEPVNDRLWQTQLASGKWVLRQQENTIQLMVPIVPEVEARPFLADLLELNFNTGLAHYAFSQGLLWGTFHHALDTLVLSDLETALSDLQQLQSQGLSQCFEQHVDRQVRQIIAVAKQKNQDLQTTLQQIERLYREGILGDMNDSTDRMEATISRWRDRLKRLWTEN